MTTFSDFKNAVPIHSEEIEPFAAMIVGRLWKRCEVAKATGDGIDLESACQSFWFGLQGLEKLAIAAGTATHFSIAMNNEHRRVAAISRASSASIRSMRSGEIMKFHLEQDSAKAMFCNTIGVAGFAADAWFNATSHGEPYTIEICPSAAGYIVKIKDAKGEATLGYLAKG